MKSAHRLIRTLCTAAAFLWAAPALHAQTIVYVNAAAPSEGDGTSWATPHKYLAVGLANAALKADAGQTVQVWIAAGIYLPDQSPSNPAGGLDDDATFTLHNSVSLYGGFTGAETSLDQADPAANSTGLHGFIRDGNSYYGTRHLMTGTGIDSSVVVDGIDITNPRWRHGGGKGIRLIQSSPTFRRCTIRDLRNDGSHAPSVYTSGGTPVFEDCTFLRNKAGAPDAHGGAIYCAAGGLTVRGCLFDSNGADGIGGAIYSTPTSAVLIEDSVFRQNYTKDMLAGAAYLGAGSIVRRCTFDDNWSAYSCGALATAGLVEDSVFIGNSAGSSFSGGAASGTGTFVNCLFSDNYAYFGGAISGPSTNINCTFINNRARWNGALDGNGTSINCRFLNNQAHGSASTSVAGGGGTFLGCVFSGNNPTNVSNAGILRAGGNDLTVINCTFSANNGQEVQAIGAGRTATVRNSILYKTAGALPQESAHISATSGASVIVRNSFLQGLGSGHAGNGNLGGSQWLDPRFVDAPGPDGIAGTSDDDLRLRPGSFCIDAGDSGAVPPTLSVDAAGNPRFTDDPGMPDAGSLTQPVVDMGAYEFQGTSCLADFNGDGFADGIDSDQFFNLYEARDPAADLNRDSFLDGIDLDLFNNAFEVGC